MNRFQSDELADLGWQLSPAFEWSNSRQYDIAFLLAPNIPVPNIGGNAIASLVTALAEGMQFNSIIFSMRPENSIENNSTHMQFHLAHYQKDLSPSILDRGKILPRIKSLLITPTYYSWRKYARDAVKASVLLGVKCLVVEDVADFGWVVRKVRKHGVHVVLHQHAFTQRNYRTYLWRCIERNLDKIIFVSNKTRNMTEMRHGKLKVPVSVIYNGVNLDHYDPLKWKGNTDSLREVLRLKNFERVLTFIGRLHHSKGVIQALNAYLAMGNINIAFIIVGSKEGTNNDDYFQEVLSNVNEAVAQGYPIYIFENIGQDLIPAYYGLSDYILLPSMGHEGLPKVVTEALAMGIPVIASDRGGIWELLEEGRNGWLIADPVSPQTILAALSTALSTTDSELAMIKKSISDFDRPKMDQQRMISSFQQELIETMGEI